jgi:3-methyladenine DNA glycosylase/8-oxoguanine DNA glycosylase
MSRLRFSWGEAVAHLRGRCDRMAAFIDVFGSRRLAVRKDPDLFTALARAIAYQQLSGKAAATIHGRFEALFPERRPAAELAVTFEPEALRACGLSRAKTLSILDLAERSVSGELPTPGRIARMSDQEVIDSLCRVRGIGPWTAQMFLIFNLGRPDVMPAADLGVQKGLHNIYRMRSVPAPERVMRVTRKFAPYRTAAAWYAWRASDDRFST